MPDGSIKISKAELYRKVNQHRGDWELATSRELARFLKKNNDKIITH